MGLNMSPYRCSDPPKKINAHFFILCFHRKHLSVSRLPYFDADDADGFENGQVSSILWYTRRRLRPDDLFLSSETFDFVFFFWWEQDMI